MQGHEIEGAPAIRRFAVRTPTLPPATHTNASVVGDGRTGLAVVDPGSPYADQQEALTAYLTSLGAPVVAVVLSHHHVDHVGGVLDLARRFAAPILAHPLTAQLLAGRIAVDRTVEEGEVLPFAGGLEALHTPGHASGHLCFADARSGAVLAGDMVASIGTIIIDPAPGEGDMRLYLASLERLRARRAPLLLPSHGDPIVDPDALLGFYLAHRREREERVVLALRAGAAPVEELVPRAYPDVAPALYALAARSLTAHLFKLRGEARAEEQGGRWRLTG